MNILVIGAGGAADFEALATARGHGVRRLPPGAVPDAVEPGSAVVFFDSGAAVAATAERVRYLSVRVVAAGPDTPPAQLLAELAAAGPVAPLTDDERARVVEPFAEALRTTLREWAGTEAFERAAYRRTFGRAFGDVAVALPLDRADGGAEVLVLSFPEGTARALAARALSGTHPEPDRDVVLDCLGEIANVTAGQAKALLLGTPDHFTLRTPQLLTDANPDAQPRPGAGCLVVVFGTDAGDLALQLCREGE